MCWIWIPVCWPMISGKFCAGDCAISSAVITLVEAPVMPAPSRLDDTSIGGKTTSSLLLLCPLAGATSSALSARPAQAFRM